MINPRPPPGQDEDHHTRCQWCDRRSFLKICPTCLANAIEADHRAKRKAHPNAIITISPPKTLPGNNSNRRMTDCALGSSARLLPGDSKLLGGAGGGSFRRERSGMNCKLQRLVRRVLLRRNDIVFAASAGTKITFCDNGKREKWEGMRISPCAAWDDWGDPSND